MEPDDLEVQVGAAKAGLSQTDAQAGKFLRPVRRAIQLEDRPAERLQLEVDLCTLASRFADRNPTWDSKLGEECVRVATRILERDLLPMARGEVLASRGRVRFRQGDVPGSLRDLDAAIELAPSRRRPRGGSREGQPRTLIRVSRWAIGW